MSEIVKERLAQRARQLSEMLRRDAREHYASLAEARAKGIRVAWEPGGLVDPLLDALGIAGCSPEQYSALSAMKQIAGRFCDVAEAHGISQDLCAYGRCIMGMMYENDGPLGPLPVPDFIIPDASICDAHAKMWDIPARHFKVPVFRLDGTFQLYDEPSEADIAYRAGELRRLVSFCQEHFGVKFDYDRFQENMRREGQMRTLLSEVQDLRKEIPCPRSTRDMASDMFYVVTMPHSPQTVEYVGLVAEDCRERVKHKIGVVDNERFRLYWDNIPIWFWMQFYDFFHERGAVFASDAYSNIMFNGYYAQGGQFDPERPFESLALRQMYMQIVSGIEPNLDRHARLIKDWHCDGVVLLVNRSCKAFTSGRFDKKMMIARDFDIPILEFEGDMSNPTSIDKVDVMERANVFLDMLAARAAKSAPG